MRVGLTPGYVCLVHESTLPGAISDHRRDGLQLVERQSGTSRSDGRVYLNDQGPVRAELDRSFPFRTKVYSIVLLLSGRSANMNQERQLQQVLQRYVDDGQIAGA